VSLKDLLDDQRAFNKLIWSPEGKSDTDRAERLRVLFTGMVEESVEFIRTYEYKTHRRSSGHLPNVAHSHSELIDMLKYWLSMADLADFPIDKIEEFYHAKSRVVQYRYQEEFLNQIDRPSVVVDIDQVLADYVTGICRWTREWGTSILKLSPSESIRFNATVLDLMSKGQFVDHKSLNISIEQWRLIKHYFRVNGGKLTLPVFLDAKPFLEWCRANGWLIILVTSRPFDQYPNLFADTITWLESNHLPFDYLWWASNKARRLEEAHVAMISQIVFAVDDILDFVEQFRSRSIKTYHLDRFAKVNDRRTLQVDSLAALMAFEGQKLRFNTPKQVIDRNDRNTAGQHYMIPPTEDV